jgi:hypothetical protein
MGQVYFSTLSGKILQTFLSIRMPPGPLVLWEFFTPSGFRVNGCLTKHLTQKNISIDWQELYAIVVASYIWAPLWAQKQIVFYCDNQAVVSIINSKHSKSPRIMDLVHALTIQTLKYNFYFRAFHVPGHYNDIADAISRFQQTRFWRNLYQRNFLVSRR